VLVSTVTDEGIAEDWTQDGVVLAPGEHGVARVTVRPTGFGRWTRVFTLASNDPQHPKARMVLSASIQPRFTIAPRRVDLGEWPAGRDTAIAVSVASARTPDFSIEAVEVFDPRTVGGQGDEARQAPAPARPPSLSASFARAAADSSRWIVLLQLGVDAPPGPLVATVRIHTNDPVLPSVEIAVLASLTGGLAYPPQVEIASRFAGVAASATVPIRRRQGPAFHITGVSINSEYLRTELITREEGAGYDIEITLLPDMPAGRHALLLSVQTDRPDVAQFTVPLLVRVGRTGPEGGD
jgi:hypothetical protein